MNADYFTDETPVHLELTLGEARALGIRMHTAKPCRGRCGDVLCELMGYVGDSAMAKFIDAVFAGDEELYDSKTLDARAAALARMDQWRAELVARGVL